MRKQMNIRHGGTRVITQQKRDVEKAAAKDGEQKNAQPVANTKQESENVNKS